MVLVCGLRGALEEALATFLDVLNHYNLADLTANWDPMKRR